MKIVDILKDKETINCFDFDKVNRVIEQEIIKYFNHIMPKIEELYTFLENGNYIANLDTHNGNLDDLYDDGNIYAGILNNKKLNFNSRALYFYTESGQWIVIFNPERREDLKSDIYNNGISIFRVYNELDVDCIENAWGCTNTKKFATNADLIVNEFTDITEYSQKIKEHIVCKRPTLKRLINDYNNNEFQHYSPVLSTIGYTKTNGNLGEINCIIRSLMVLAFRIHVKGVEL